MVGNHISGNHSLRSYEGLKWVFVTRLLMPTKVVFREELVTCSTSAVHAKFGHQIRRQFKISQVILEESRTATFTLGIHDTFAQPVFEIGIVGQHGAMDYINLISNSLCLLDTRPDVLVLREVIRLYEICPLRHDFLLDLVKLSSQLLILNLESSVLLTTLSNDFSLSWML